MHVDPRSGLSTQGLKGRSMMLYRAGFDDAYFRSPAILCYSSLMILGPFRSEKIDSTEAKLMSHGKDRLLHAKLFYRIPCGLLFQH
jgi:hypothetical protein